MAGIVSWPRGTKRALEVANSGEIVVFSENFAHLFTLFLLLGFH